MRVADWLELDRWAHEHELGTSVLDMSFEPATTS